MPITIYFKTDLNILKYVTERINMKYTRERYDLNNWYKSIKKKKILLYTQEVN